MNKLNEYYLGLKFAFSYFTILPVKFRKDDDLNSEIVLKSMILFLPFLGLVLGLITIFSYNLIDNLTWLAALLAALLYFFLYGFIHTEAILDVVDAIYARHGKKDAYEVIKESSVGAMGVLYSFSFVLLKIALIVYLFLNNFFLEFLAILIISRLTLPFLIVSFDFKSSFVSSLKESLCIKSLIFTFLLSFLLILIFLGFKTFTLFFLGFLISYLIFIFIEKKLGFLNGDALGMTLELTEIFLFLTVCILWL